MNDTLIEAYALSKKYTTIPIIHDISFSLQRNSVVALLGTNGAGKTTLIQMLLGLKHPSSGIVTMNGLSPTDHRARKNLGVVLQVSEFLEVLTPAELLCFVAQHFEAPACQQHIIVSFSLDHFLHKRVKLLSQGQKRRLGLALAFIGNPKIIFLDEPTVGLDLQSRTKIWEYIKNYPKKEVLIVLTTHSFEEAQILADRIMILHQGRIVADGSLTQIQQQFANVKVRFRLQEESSWLQQQHKVLLAPHDDILIETADGDDLVRALIHNDVQFYDLQVTKSNLDDIFLKLVGV